MTQPAVRPWSARPIGPAPEGVLVVALSDIGYGDTVLGGAFPGALPIRAVALGVERGTVTGHARVLWHDGHGTWQDPSTPYVVWRP